MSSRQSLLDEPWVGASWEGFVIEQILAVLALRDVRVEPFFFRTSDQHEIDLVLDFGTRLVTVEVKLTSAPGPGDMSRLNKDSDLLRADWRVLVSQTRHVASNAREVSCALPWLVTHVDRVFGLT